MARRGLALGLPIIVAVLIVATGARAVAPPPPGFDRSTPRATVRHFLQAIAADRPDIAAAALRVPADAITPPAELARLLGTVIDRRLWLTADDLPDRPDGLTPPAPGETTRNADPRDTIALGALDFGRFPLTVRLNRYCDLGPTCLWLFDPEVVAAAPALHARYGPGWLERLMPATMRARGPLGLRWWEWAALPSLLALSAMLGFLVHAALGILRHRLPQPAAAGFAVAQVPGAVLAGALAMQYGLTVLVAFSAAVTVTARPLLLAIIVASAMVLALRVADAVMERLTDRFVGPGEHRADPDRRQLFTSVYAMRRIATLIAFAAGLGLFLYEFNVFASVGLSLLTSAGVATVVLGIAAQTVLGNILASLQIALAKPIRIGDAVAYEGEWSYVEAIYFTYVRLCTWDDRRLVVPVQYFISHPFENWSVVEGKMTRAFWLTLDHQADTAAVRRRFEEMARQDDAALHDEMLKMLVLEHDSAGVRCCFYITANDPTAAWNLHARMQEGLIAWIRENHPEWWPRERVQDSGEAARAAAA